MLKKEWKLKPGQLISYLWEIGEHRKELKIDKPPHSVHLNLGCGDDIRYGYINCDKIKLKGVNILLDLDKPLPFKSNSIDSIMCRHVIAHIKHPRRLKKETDRILKMDGRVYFTPCTCNCEHKYRKGGEYKKVL